ncbi:MAG: hypothetical protein ACREJN_03200 [Nitrospiraceae bacterium]
MNWWNMRLLRKSIESFKESLERRQGQTLERILHNAGSGFVLELGLAMLVFGGADCAKLLRRIEPHTVKTPLDLFLTTSFHFKHY